MNGLAPHTASIFEAVSRLACIKPYVLVGGTALALQLSMRQSEDLDFMSWRKKRNEKREVDWPQIKKELETVGNVEKCDILDIDHVEFMVNGVKLSPTDEISPKEIGERIMAALSKDESTKENGLGA